MLKPLVLALALAAGATAQAQTAAAPAAAASQPASPAKKALVAKLLQLQQPAYERLAANLAVAPAMQMRPQIGAALQQRVAADRREAVARQIEGDLRQYAEDASAIARDRVVKLAPATVGPLYESQLTEDELRQAIGILESPVFKKMVAMDPEVQRALGEKLVADIRGTIEPKVRALNQTVAKRLAPPAPAAPAASAAKP